MPSAADSSGPSKGTRERARRSVDALDALDAHYEEIDREVDRLVNEHAERLRCRRGCSACCLDDLTVVSVEAERIRRAHADFLREAVPGPVGACAFLDGEGACRIYKDRPSVCRSQGLPLLVYYENDEDEIEERRDICPLNLEGGPPLESLADESLWLIGPRELRLTAIDAEFSGDDAPRVRLRDLFSRSRESDPR